MDKYMKRSFTKLRTALAILIACCLTTDMYAQTAVAADSVKPATNAMVMPTTERHNEMPISFCWKCSSRSRAF